ncbi:hypothetical protein AB0K00_50585 [Dactylosporangium sp. NPDC049525]|uniref:hypothetical protein n=1 Tax=Dactylosporangium sp. NPDC049525 TaxID=3154730 RepID=UPI00341FE689
MNNSFDFIVGTWTSTQRRLRKVLAGSDDWYEFPATSRAWNVMGGAGNVDEIDFPTQGFSGVTLRLYDPATELWSLYWASSRTGLTLPPMVGRFGEDGRGVFSGDDVYDGVPIRCNYIWSRITPESARWEQEFSADGGQTWETNWIMDFTRA